MFGLSHFWPQLQLQNQAFQRAALQANAAAKLSLAQNSLKTKLPSVNHQSHKSSSVSSDEDSSQSSKSASSESIVIPNSVSSSSSEPSKSPIFTLINSLLCYAKQLWYYDIDACRMLANMLVECSAIELKIDFFVIINICL